MLLLRAETGLRQCRAGSAESAARAQHRDTQIILTTLSSHTADNNTLLGHSRMLTPVSEAQNTVYGTDLLG